MTAGQRNKPYYLHSILVHEGSSEYGHYYAFVFDRNKRQWFRFNDHKVDPVEEKVVFEEAFGSPYNKLNQCAYSLMYVNDAIAKK